MNGTTPTNEHLVSVIKKNLIVILSLRYAFRYHDKTRAIPN